jgi:hypothetical protein
VSGVLALHFIELGWFPAGTPKGRLVTNQVMTSAGGSMGAVVP